ncbi:MAG: glycosyltransferase family 39 protein [Bacteroidota bacterium]
MKRQPAHSKAPGGKQLFGTAKMDVLIPAVIALAAISLRLAFISSLRETPFFLQHFSDTKLYMQLASQILGDGIPQAYFMSPLYPYMIALIWKATGNPELWVRILQALFGGGTALLTYFIGKMYFSRSTGIVAGAIVALYAPLIYYDGLLLTESLQTLLFTGHLLILLAALEKREIKYWIGAGVLLGLSVITRANIIVFLPAFLVIWMFLKKESKPSPRSLLAYAFATIMVIVPITLHNAAAEGVLIPTTSSLGYNLYAGNNSEATGLYTMPDGVDLSEDLNGTHWVEKQTGRNMNSAQVSDFWRDRALGWMGTHPGDAAILFARKILLFFHPGEIDQLGLSMRFYTNEYGWVIGLPPGAFPVLLILSAIGLLLAFRDGTATWVPPLFLLVYVLSTAVFFISGRLRLPVLPILILYAASALVVLVQRSKEGRFASLRIPVAAGAVAALALIFLQPEVRQGFEQEYLKIGQASFNTGAYPEAERRFRASLNEQVTVDALVNLGNALAAQKRVEEAAEQYREALNMDSTAALAWFNYGNLRMQTGSPQYAYGYWKKAIECDPFLGDARRNLGLLLMQAGRLPEAREQLTKYLELEPDPKRRSEINRDLERIRQILEKDGR